jgi:hypothetical protein
VLVLLMGRICEVAIQMGSGAMIHMPSLIKIGSGIQKLGGIHVQTQTAR